MLMKHFVLQYVLMFQMKEKIWNNKFKNRIELHAHFVLLNKI